MIDIKFIRENSELVQANCIRRGFEVDIDALLKLDAESRRLSQESEAPVPNATGSARSAPKIPPPASRSNSSKRCSPPRRRRWPGFRSRCIRS
ncbi:MAG: hypothetical protein L6W00_13045 [Lentisphaeria bacterium]|nr:MAG: hypothetical protein L6W00_13045 [Lentisphaeria bacterium]